ncbi:unnamed protein product [Clonostachys rhizophaga]|uniref:DUF676 domain-containing protein n=1 Tax=Clonostachys rhizophaga TaxID=160324 RepID=A0A9N9VFS2_9HYPO|nr:unnamed protein product [Clonostachys rhizophaga]
MSHPPSKPPSAASSSLYPPPPPYEPQPSSTSPAPSPYSLNKGHGSSLLSADPRTSSTQSICSIVSESDQRRTLLVIYIHGFYGNDQSFRSFPYHVHAFLRSALADSHVIHSKVYPRYKTYRAIEVARDNFSEWLAPHESPTTDVILVGHSMGGILAADVVLMPNRSPYQRYPFKHRILGTIALDTPFLGLHPGIVVAGISSLFQPAASPPGDQQGEPSSHQYPSEQVGYQPPNRRETTDPLFDPPFFNDNPFREAPFMKRIVNFAKKHRSEGLMNATAKHVLSHIEYGGCLADFSGLRLRYDRIRSLEDIDELQALNDGHPEGKYVKVRFVNYYTLSSGRHKQPKSPEAKSVDSREETPATPGLPEAISSSIEPGNSWEGDTMAPSIRPSTLSTSTLGNSDGGLSTPPSLTESKMKEAGFAPIEIQPATQEVERDMNRLSMQELEPIPMVEVEPEPDTASVDTITTPDNTTTAGSIFTLDQITTAATTTIADSTTTLDHIGTPDSNLPPVPDPPTPLETPDFDQYTDKDARKQAEKEFKRQKKAYDQAVKDHSRAVRERQKIEEKRRRKAQKEQDKQEKQAKRELEAQLEAQKQRDSPDTAADPPTQPVTQNEEVFGQIAEKLSTVEEVHPRSPSIEVSTPREGEQQKKKRKKFCVTPGKTNGVRDRTWVDVYMDGMDEVGAHCGLFFPGPHYDRLIGDVGSRVVNWVQDDLTKRLIMEMS